MQGKRQRPQMTRPTESDMKSVQTLGAYMRRHVKRADETNAEIYQLLSALEERVRRLEEARNA